MIIKKKSCRQVDFAVLADHKVKMKESKKRYKYLDLARGLRKLWNLKASVIQIVIGALEMIPEDLEKDTEALELRRIETTHTTALLRSARILLRVLKT